MSNVRVRIAPSPTGFLHIGRVRTILFNYLFAKQQKGAFIFRIEDTDKERSKEEFVTDIIEGLEWLGIVPDEGPYYQSQRTEVYQSYIKKMIEAGSAYEAEESKDGSGKVIRLKNPNQSITFTDVIRGEVTFDTTELGDFVIARNIEEPLYHLTVVVDDHEMNITHVIRGEDGISNTPRQILIQEAIEAMRPIYAHIPLILAEDRSKLSGRHGAVSLNEYRKEGYLPEAIINYLALLGWHPKGEYGEQEQEIFSLNDLIKEFDITRIQKGGAVMNMEKLNWFNRVYIEKLDNEEFKQHLKTFFETEIDDTILNLASLYKGRAHTFQEIVREVRLLTQDCSYTKDLITRNNKIDPDQVGRHLQFLQTQLSQVQDTVFHSVENVESVVMPYADENGRGEVLWPLRVALSGQEKSPGPFELIWALGRTEVQERIQYAISLLKK